MQVKFTYSIFIGLFILLSASLAAFLGESDPSRAQTFGNGLIDTGTVNFMNRSAKPLFVTFTIQSGRPGPVVWSTNCQRFNDEVRLAPGQSCTASVPSSAGPSRFCASENPEPTGKAPNCFEAQRNNETIIETNFTSGATCDRNSQKSCIWYDISVVPAGCTNCDWIANNCKDTGGASYNVPVQLACTGSPTFTCRGPVAPIGASGAKYPVNCGTPFYQPTCIGGLNAACLQAYFFPMSTSGACQYPTNKPQPIAQCPQGETLIVNFLDGQ